MSYEPLIEQTINVFLEQWDRRFAGKKGADGVIKLEDWLLYFSFDVIGQLTYGSRHGFLESGYDSQGIINFLQGFAVYGAVVRSFPSVPCVEYHTQITKPDGPFTFLGSILPPQSSPNVARAEGLLSTDNIFSWTFRW